MKSLSPREQQVVELLVGGLTQKEVARKLGISQGAVRSYIRRVQLKSGQPTVLAAVAFVLLMGEVLPNSA